MARGFFDILKEQQDRGMGAFSGKVLTPQEIQAAYSQGQPGGFLDQDGYPVAPEGTSSQGQATREVMKLIWTLANRKKNMAAKQQAQQQGRSDDRAMDAIRQRAAELSATGMPMEEAFGQASNEVFGETAGMTRAKRYKDAVGRVAPQVYTEAANFGGEAKQYAPVFNTWADFDTGETVQVNMKDKKEVMEAQKRGLKRLGDVTIQWGQIGNTDTEQAYNVIPGVGMTPIPGLRRKRGKTEVNVNIGDERTESQRGLAYGEALVATRGFQSANAILDQIEGLSDTLDFSPVGIPGSMSQLANTISGVGEFAQSLVSATDGIPLQDVRGGKIYDNGKMSYSDLIDPSKYTEELKGLAKAGITSSRVQAAMIELAYMMAVAEEGSARAISDNDLKLRLKTLGDNISTKEGFRTILEDTRDRLYIKYKSLTENDPIFTTAKDEGFLKSRVSSMLEKYKPRDRERPPEKKPEYQIIRPGDY